MVKERKTNPGQLDSCVGRVNNARIFERNSGRKDKPENLRIPHKVVLPGLDRQPGIEGGGLWSKANEGGVQPADGAVGEVDDWLEKVKQSIMKDVMTQRDLVSK